MQTVANLESELEELRNYNDAYENEVLNSVDLEEIKQKAIGKLGMKYPDAEHVQEYDANSKGYMTYIHMHFTETTKRRQNHLPSYPNYVLLYLYIYFSSPTI